MLLNFKILASEIYVAFLAFEAVEIVPFTLAMGMVDLILGTFLPAWSRFRRKPLLLKIYIYIYYNFFSLIKPLEHFKMFTFYIIEKNILILKIGEI